MTILLNTGLSIREGSGFNLWTEEGHQIQKALQKKIVEPFQLFEKFGEDVIKDQAVTLANNIQRSGSFSDTRIRSLNLRINNSWIGLLGEYAVGYLCQEAGIPWTHSSLLGKEHPDLHLFNKYAEIKAWPLACKRLEFLSESTRANIAQKWNGVDYFITLRHTAPFYHEGNDPFVHLKIFPWLFIDTKAFWSKHSMFDGLFFDHEKAKKQQLMIDLS